MFNTEQEAYQEFRSIVREHTNRILVWIGSGLSQSAGFPSWSSLRDSLCVELKNNARNIVEDAKEISRLLEAANKAKKESDLWIAFEILKRELGDTSFVSTIRAGFKSVDTCPIPVIYRKLWDLPIKGILNLNLDRLASRSFVQKRGDSKIIEFHGNVAGHYAHVLKDPAPFVVDLHGTLSDSGSWVFTHNEMKEIIQNHGYQEFLHTCLIDSVVLFIGITADDIAVGGHLERLKKWDIDFGQHYWLTDRGDTETRKWCETAGVRMIRYTSDGNHHAIEEFFADLQSYIPKEAETVPVAMELAVDQAPALSSPEELSKMEPNTARILLNEYASWVLRERTPEAYERYRKFCKEYGRAIHNAWYVTTREADNELFDYMLLDEINGGAFGRVFAAKDREGRPVAIKILKEDVQRKPELLKSFRRGVASMQILANRKVEGMIEYLQASEIPTFVVMELVQGPNLREAVDAGYISDWPTVMRVAVDLAHIIRSAHLLPERVLHRDLRPSNIMLKDYYSHPENYKVVVLDFDLSWHRGAIEDSLVGDTTLNGYLAPEQVEHMPSSYTRNALIDSFGMGMTLFFLRTALQPQLLQHRHSNWNEYVYNSVEKHQCPDWRSLPRRYARLVDICTRDKQALRWDMSQIKDELERLQEALLNPESVESAELWAEELATRVEHQLDVTKTYTWNQDRGVATFRFASGVELRIGNNEAERRVKAWINWMSAGNQEYKRIYKYLPGKCEKATARLKKCGWRVLESKHNINMVHYGVEMSVSRISERIDEAVEALSNTASEFEFK